MRTQTRLLFPAILLAIFLMLVVTSCDVDKDENKPVVTTYEVTAIKSTEALCGGTITSDGGFGVTSRGVCWSTDSIPTIDDNKTTDSIGAGSYTSQITSLQPKTNYYVRAYATNSNGTGYGMAKVFETYGAATLTTAEITEISYTSAVCGGTITSDGDQTITARGVCWSTSLDSLELGKALDSTVNGSGIGSFESVISKLSSGTTYYVRAYATHSMETNYGNTISFTTREYGKMTDINGNIYNTVTIGTQTWMAENLKVAKYNDGTNIPNVTDATAWRELTTGALCDYDNTPSNSETYGKLYNWHAVNTGKLCPTGWHLPSDAEWTTLTTYLGVTVAGGKLKETGTTHWNSPNAGATNETGFTALPGGLRYVNGSFYCIGDLGLWWSATEGSTNAWYRDMSYNASRVDRSIYSKELGVSVRCVKD